MRAEPLHGRGAGILMPLSSLPGPHGIGGFGDAAFRWVDFLAQARQRYWQILPLGPTGWGDSPYQSFSSFAISPYYIDLDGLIEEGLLEKGNFEGIFWGEHADRVDYGALYENRGALLRLACVAFSSNGGFHTEEFIAFNNENDFWLHDYALFMALKTHFGGKSWQAWPKALKLRDRESLEKSRADLIGDIAFHCFVQYMNRKQWDALHAYARNAGVTIIGDLPIYVALDSADTWARPELFQLDRNGSPLRVAGCPPDPFAAGGQLWGNPLYRWDVAASDGFAWYLSRMRANFDLYDVIRIDHFRGLESYFSIAAGAPDAREGEWVTGPGRAFVDALRRDFPDGAIIAEDLGFLTDGVRDLLRYSGFPGMKVLQFAFDSRDSSSAEYMPYRYQRNCVAYTGTHDNPPMGEWVDGAADADVQRACDYLGCRAADRKRFADAAIRAVLTSVADTAIIPLQDWLGLSGGRVNTPATARDNWTWRLKDGSVFDDDTLARRIRKLTEITGRA